MKKRYGVLLATMILAFLLSTIPAAKAQMVTGKRMTDFAKVFGLEKNPSGDP